MNEANIEPKKVPNNNNCTKNRMFTDKHECANKTVLVWPWFEGRTAAVEIRENGEIIMPVEAVSGGLIFRRKT